MLATKRAPPSKQRLYTSNHFYGVFLKDKPDLRHLQRPHRRRSRSSRLLRQAWGCRCGARPRGSRRSWQTRLRRNWQPGEEKVWSDWLVVGSYLNCKWCWDWWQIGERSVMLNRGHWKGRFSMKLTQLPWRGRKFDRSWVRISKVSASLAFVW